MVVVTISILGMPPLFAEMHLQGRRLDSSLPAELDGSREQLSRTRPRSRDVSLCNILFASNKQSLHRNSFCACCILAELRQFWTHSISLATACNTALIYKRNLQA